MRLWNRTEPLKSTLLWAVALIVLLECFLILGGKWVLIDQSERVDDDSYVLGSRLGVVMPATRSWRVLNCTYWTGRSSQSVEFSEDYGSAPRECPFVTDAS